jgi:hypothetical protein
MAGGGEGWLRGAQVVDLYTCRCGGGGGDGDDDDGDDEDEDEDGERGEVKRRRVEQKNKQTRGSVAFLNLDYCCLPSVRKRRMMTKMMMMA